MFCVTYGIHQFPHVLQFFSYWGGSGVRTNMASSQSRKLRLNRSFILIPMFKVREGGFKTISISVELFSATLGKKDLISLVCNEVNISSCVWQQLDSEKLKLWWDQRRWNSVALVSVEAPELGKINFCSSQEHRYSGCKTFFFF